MERPIKRKGRRTPNAFFLFSNENRKRLIDQNPGLGNRQISEKLGDLWSQLDCEAKQEFIEKSVEIRGQRLNQCKGFQCLTKVVH